MWLRPVPRSRCGIGEPSPDADVGRVRPVVGHRCGRGAPKFRCRCGPQGHRSAAVLDTWQAAELCTVHSAALGTRPALYCQAGVWVDPLHRCHRLQVRMLKSTLAHSRARVPGDGDFARRSVCMSVCRAASSPCPTWCVPLSSNAATSAPGLRSPLPHLHRDWAHPCHICTESGRQTGHVAVPPQR